MPCCFAGNLCGEIVGSESVVESRRRLRVVDCSISNVLYEHVVCIVSVVRVLLGLFVVAQLICGGVGSVDE